MSEKILTYLKFINESEHKGISNRQKDFLDNGFGVNNWEYFEDTNTVSPRTSSSFRFPNEPYGFILSFPRDLNMNFLGLNFSDIDFFSYYGVSIDSLAGSPEKATSFEITDSKIKNLIGGPKTIESNYVLERNHELESLEGSPDIIWGTFTLKHSPKLKSLDGFPKNVKTRINIDGVNISGSLAGIPDNPILKELTVARSGITSLINSPKVDSCKEFNFAGNNMITPMGVENMVDLNRFKGISPRELPFNFTNNLVKISTNNYIFSDAIYSYIKNGSWNTSHRKLIRYNKEELSTWFGMVKEYEKKAFMESLELSNEDAADADFIIDQLNFLFTDKFVCDFIRNLDIIDPKYITAFGTKIDLETIGF